MALQTLNTIKNWFKTGLKPTQTQFWDTWDSFRHKYEKVPVKDVEGLDELLLSKAEKTVLNDHLADKIAHASQINTDWNSESGFSQLLNKPDFKTINGEAIVGNGNINIESNVPTLQQVGDASQFKYQGNGSLFGVGSDYSGPGGIIIGSEGVDQGSTISASRLGISIHSTVKEKDTSNYGLIQFSGETPPIGKSLSYKLDSTKDSGTYTLATKSDFKTINNQSLIGTGDISIKEGTQDLQQTLDNGSIAILDSGKATIALGTGTNGNRQSAVQHTDENNVAALSIDNREIMMQTGSISKGTTGTISLESTRAPYISYSTGGNAEKKIETTITFENPTANSILNFPSKEEGTYTLATKDDINIPVSETQSGIVDNTPLQELGGVDKYINGVRIGRGNNITSLSNTVLGSDALMSSTTAKGNTAIGESVLSLSTTGDYNTGVGSGALSSLITGTQNVAIGGAALYNLTTGNYNLAIGTNALPSLQSGQRNVVIGAVAGYGITGDANTALGTSSNGNKTALSTGNYNTTLGFQSGNTLTTGSHNTLIESPTQITITTGNYNVILNRGDNATGITTGSNNTLLGGINGLNGTDSNLVVIGDGQNNVAIRKEADNRLLAPTLTKTLINSGGAKSLITKEYLDEKTQIKDKQISISSNEVTVSENWNGQTLIFENSCTVTVPMLFTEEFTFNAITLEGVNLTWQSANQIEWIFGVPEVTPEKKYFNLTKLRNTNQIILSV